MTGASDTFSATQAAQANTVLRAALGLPPERFPVPRFVAMISDEIEQLRAAGHDDTAIARLVCEGTGGTLTASDIAAHYAPPDARGWAGNPGDSASHAAEKPNVVSSTEKGVVVKLRTDEAEFDAIVPRDVIEEVFQITGESDEDCREVIETNLDAVRKAALDRFANEQAARDSRSDRSQAEPLVLVAADLVGRGMHIVGDAAKRAAD